MAPGNVGFTVLHNSDIVHPANVYARQIRVPPRRMLALFLRPFATLYSMTPWCTLLLCRCSREHWHRKRATSTDKPRGVCCRSFDVSKNGPPQLQPSWSTGDTDSETLHDP